MSDTFFASNGMKFTTVGGEVRWESGFPCNVVSQGLREYFLAERDQELGRWRDPSRPEYVVYPFDRIDIHDPYYRECVVLNEDTGESQRFGTDMTSCHGGTAKEVARVYFAAHPVVRPWHKADSGEVWKLTVDGVEGVWKVGEERFFATGSRWVALDYWGITDGTMIWPQS